MNRSHQLQCLQIHMQSSLHLLHEYLALMSWTTNKFKRGPVQTLCDVQLCPRAQVID